MSRSRAFLGFVFLLLFAVTDVSAATEDTARSAATRIVLPADGFLPRWVKSDSLQRFTGKNLYGYINGGAELFLEFGFKELQVQRYVENDRELALEVFVMASAPAALGIYLMRCGDETPIVGIATRNSGDRYQFTITRGDCFLLVNNFDGDSALLPVMTVLAQHVLMSIPEGAPVTMFEHLPPENLIAGSERLIRGPYGLQPIFTLGPGDILQLGGEIFALVGEYASGADQTYTRIVIPYPDAQVAVTAYTGLLANLDPYLTVLARGENLFTFEDFQNKFGSVELEGRTMTIRVRLAEMPELK